jgi:glycosyltransferase involved in cell wall biosynthesis
VDSGEPMEHLRGVTLAKQFPNPEEPIRGLFVADQIAATRMSVDWRIIAPVPWIPSWLAPILGKPYVKGDGDFAGIPVYRPRYPVLPKRMLYAAVAPAVARAERRAFQTVLAEQRPQFVHAHALYPTAAAARRVVAGTNLPLIVTIHGSDLYTNISFEKWRAELRAVVDATHTIVCVSEQLSRDAQAQIGAERSRTVIIPDAYNDSVFRYVERPVRAGPKRLIAVGRLVDVKGHDVLVDALAALVQGGEDVVLTIVGGGPLERELDRRIDSLGLTDRVRMVGAVTGERLHAELVSSDLFVMPSRKEGFGVSLVEGLATGLPAVATRSGGPESIVGPEDGVLVNPNDTESLASGIASALRQLDLYDHEAIANRARERYSREAVGKQLVALYRRVVTEAGT